MTGEVGVFFAQSRRGGTVSGGSGQVAGQGPRAVTAGSLTEGGRRKTLSPAARSPAGTRVLSVLGAERGSGPGAPSRAVPRRLTSPIADVSAAVDTQQPRAAPVRVAALNAPCVDLRSFAFASVPYRVFLAVALGHILWDHWRGQVPLILILFLAVFYIIFARWTF